MTSPAQKPSPAFAEEGWVRVFFFLRARKEGRKRPSPSRFAGPSLSREGGSGVCASLFLLALLTSCHRAEPTPSATTPAPQGLEAAAIQAGVITDPASTDITGLYATENDRVCIVPTATAYRIGVFVDYDERQNCGGSGTVTRVGETLHVTLDGDSGCSFDARFDGDRIVFPARVPDACQKACVGRASVAALDATRLSESVSEASTLRDAKGRLLCASGG